MFTKNYKLLEKLRTKSLIQYLQQLPEYSYTKFILSKKGTQTSKERRIALKTFLDNTR